MDMFWIIAGIFISAVIISLVLGKIYGTLMLVLFPAHLSPWYAGRLFDVSGSYDSMFPLCLVLNTLAAAGLFFLRPRPLHVRTASP